MRTLAFFLACLMPLFGYGATVTGNLLDLVGSTNNTKVKFTPKSTPQAVGTNTYYTKEKTITATNGAFSLTLIQGNYEVEMGPKPDLFYIAVPTGDDSYNISSITTSNFTTSPTNYSFVRKSGDRMTGPLAFTNATSITVGSFTTTQFNALTGTNGMIIYQSSSNVFLRYEGGAWTTFAAGSVTAAITNSIYATVNGSATASRPIALTNSATVTFSTNADGSIYGTLAGGAGTVTSVGLSLPSEITVSGSPVTGSGTLAGVWASQTANKVFAGATSGGAATPAFRLLVSGDIPDLSATYTPLAFSQGDSNTLAGVLARTNLLRLKVNGTELAGPWLFTNGTYILLLTNADGSIYASPTGLALQVDATTVSNIVVAIQARTNLTRFYVNGTELVGPWKATNSTELTLLTNANGHFYWTMTNVITAGTAVKVTYDAKGRIISTNALTTGELQAVLGQVFQATNTVLTGVAGLASTNQLVNSNQFQLATNGMVHPTTTDTLQNKTIDAANNVLKFTGYADLMFPCRVDGSGAVMQTNDPTAVAFGQATFSGSAATNVNWVEYEWIVPEDLDTSVDLKVTRLWLKTAGTSTSSATFSIGMADVASSAPADPTSFSNWVSMTLTPSSVTALDAFVISAQTLTSWKSSLTAGDRLKIRLSRDGSGDANNDAMTTLGLRIQYGVTQ